MKELMHIEARQKFDLNEVNFSALDKLRKGDISLAATVQYLDLIGPVKGYLEKQKRKVIIKKGAYYNCHVLGCNINAFEKKCDILLLLGDGSFHALNNAVQLNHEIYVFDSKKLTKIKIQEIINYNKRLEAKKKKFLMSSDIGILISTKSGQNFKNIDLLKKNLEKLNKRVYTFEGNNIDINEFENYPEIGIFVNTACFGLSRDHNKIINLNDILEYIKS